MSSRLNVKMWLWHLEKWCFIVFAFAVSFSHGALTAEEELEQLFQVTPSARLLKRGAHASIHDILEQAEEEAQKKLNAEPAIAQHVKRYANVDDAFRMHQIFLKTPDIAKDISTYNDVMENAMGIIVKRFAGKIPEDRIMNILSKKNTVNMPEKRDVDDYRIEHKRDHLRVCPFPSIRCNNVKNLYKYRTFDGSCNNIKYPLWGRSFTPFRRLRTPKYYGFGGLRRAKDGSELPSARVVSNQIYVEKKNLDDISSFLFMTWGQFIDHDMDLAALSKFKVGNATVDINCGVDGCDTSIHKSCAPIIVPKNDPFFKKKCLSFVRSEGVPDLHCRFRTRRQLNVITAFLDASMVYGNTKQVADSLREPKVTGAKLRVQVHPFDDKRKPLLPTTPVKDCRDFGGKIQCFKAGDGRVNEQIHLMVIHTIFLREHNRLIDELKKINGKLWTDEEYYQEARKILGAQIMHATYNEYNPIMLGPKILKKFWLKLRTKGYYNRYISYLNPQITAVFATAAFRYAHSMVPKVVKRPDKYFNPHGFPTLQMSETYFRPVHVYDINNGGLDALLRGFTAQKSEDSDHAFDHMVTRHMFTNSTPFGPGMDLPAISTQRGRDHGLPGYNDYRKFCGLSIIRDFDDLKKVMSKDLAYRFEKLYKYVDDIDIFAAGMAEHQLKDALVGETFGCLLGHEFRRIRHADRFWYERGGSEGFTRAQLQEIRKFTIAKLFCNNGDWIDKMPLEVMKVLDKKTNPLVDCRKIPDINLKQWRVIRRPCYGYRCHRRWSYYH